MTFDHVPEAPHDSILGLTDAFRNDPNPRKINLTVGVYRDAQGKTPIMKCVKEAEERILRSETTKDYLSIEGNQAYGRVVQELLFGEQNPIVSAGRAATVQTPGGTAALRVAADFLKKVFPQTTVWLSDPTWPNHPAIFQAAGLGVRTYPYIDARTNALAFDAMAAALNDVPQGDVVLVQGCCHNPTGIDLTPDRWSRIAQILAERKTLPLIDFAYQGLAEGIREDAAGLGTIAKASPDFLVASSFSKNFGLYNERVGALTAVCKTPAATQAVLSQLKTCVRCNYSNPPAHGAAIVATILSDPKLRSEWDVEVGKIRERINGIRGLFVRKLAEAGIDRDFSFLARQRGMFSFSGLTPEQVKRLRYEHAIYVVGSGRINVAGMTEENIDPLCAAIAKVLVS